LYEISYLLSYDQIWVQPEVKQPAPAFSKLRKLSVLGIFIEFDLVWITTFLDAARSIEILHIQVCYLFISKSFVRSSVFPFQNIVHVALS
jgi:hypothetical protein